MKGVLKNIKKKLSGKDDTPGSPESETSTGAPVESNSSLEADGNGIPEDYFSTSIPSFRDCPASERQALLIRKLRLCTYVFDFKKDSPVEVRCRELKRQTLMELAELVGQAKNTFTEPVLGDVMAMLSANLFRALPATPAKFMPSIADAEEDEPLLDENWPHLQIVFEFLLRMVVSSDVDTKILKKFINHDFLVNLLELFDSEDPRERDYLKTILHRIYGKFMSLRAFIRTAINNVFFRFIYETEKHNGIGELLEILGSIINGFALPLKEEHKNFLILVLTPLHKVRCLNSFHQQLAYCVNQFIEKDPSLSVPVITQMIKYWPLQSSAKEVLFLNELEELLELTPPEYFQKFMVPLFKQISRSISSNHFQVAERALFLWNNEYIATLVSDFRELLLPVVFPGLQHNVQNHWNPTVHSLTQNVLKIFQDMDPTLYNQCLRQYKADQEAKKLNSRRRQEQWTALNQHHALVNRLSHHPDDQKEAGAV